VDSATGHLASAEDSLHDSIACARIPGRLRTRSGLDEFLCFEHDEVLIQRLKRGIGKSGPAVEDGSANQSHIEKLDDWPEWKSIKDRLLMKSPLMEVSIEEGDPDRGIAQTLLSMDELGFHR
jgi:hypothetical protein